MKVFMATELDGEFIGLFSSYQKAEQALYRYFSECGYTENEKINLVHCSEIREEDVQ